MMQDLISIIIPVYKVEEILLRKSIESVISQSYREWECIIIDDGSPDSSGEICEEYAKANERIKVIHTKNNGVSAARNTGLELAKGQYITFLDSDDYVHENYLEHLYNMLQYGNADICACCCEYIEFSCGKQYGTINNICCENQNMILNQRQAVEDLCYIKQNYPGAELTAVWGKLYRKSIIGNTRFDKNLYIGEDFAFNYQCFIKVHRILLTSFRGYGYVIRQSGAMHNGFSEKKMMTLESLEELRFSNMDNIYADAVLTRIINIAIILLLMIPIDECIEYRKQIEIFINRDRRKIICDKKARKKVKVALLLSYLGYNNMQRLFEIWAGKIRI